MGILNKYWWHIHITIFHIYTIDRFVISARGHNLEVRGREVVINDFILLKEYILGFGLFMLSSKDFDCISKKLFSGLP